MADDIVIRAQGLGKKYLIHHRIQREDGGFLARLMTGDLVGRWASRRSAPADGSVEELWAIKDAHFEVKRGQVVGIIGRNGAGKSTLLKILSRITEPTQGRVEIRGRVASLLEVGTGFHPELTGRENIFLNGAVLGMSRSEIGRRFDEIVAFAGVEKFLDTPVKRYSSGMYVRLAFAVAAQLETEILIADEVLAVGDAEFQRKSLGKMHEAAEHGRTVLFVSHNMAAVERLCTRGLLLENGRVRFDGPVQGAISEYLGGFTGTVLEHFPESDPTRAAEVRLIALCDQNGAKLNEVTVADVPVLHVELLVREQRPDLQIAFSLHDSLQSPIFASSPADAGVAHPTQPGVHEYRIAFPGSLLLPRRYFITVSVYTRSGQSVHNCTYALAFDAVPVATPLYSAAPNRTGLVLICCKWSHRLRPAAGPVAGPEISSVAVE